MKTVAFIQARMASTRLPGKILKQLNEHSVISHLIKRLKQAEKVDEVVVLTSVNKENDELEAHLVEHGIACFRGSETDVLGRFASALNEYPAQHVVRITADSPFICPEIVDELVRKYQETGADYAFLSESFAEGVDCEVIASQVLKNIADLAKLDSEREHVTLYLFNHREDFDIYELGCDSDDSGYRFTLDTIEDQLVVEAMAAHFGEQSTQINYADIKQFFDQHPQISALNQHIIRNEGLIISLEKEGRQI
ncbi:cytidylyltransferase domain-containing protein [Pseudoalteromonas viridis]|uniref:Glycosyltransferase family protein n=1 Tax=Pseudoalteromonas viridis TaxID=339617 RepID=A0ABX7V035_9GAMM|nr:glycosyltransferase family protein [Pseudoalteromonas viridis]QTL34226.1 glycosyltransferase family protein [Pseudoalteromonas viridis]